VGSVTVGQPYDLHNVTRLAGRTVKWFQKVVNTLPLTLRAGNISDLSC
jgi:hypothetical protein